MIALLTLFIVPVATDQFSARLGVFFRAARRARGRAARPAGDGLSLAQYHLLEPLADGPLTNRQIAEQAGVSSPDRHPHARPASSRRRLVTRLDDSGATGAPF